MNEPNSLDNHTHTALPAVPTAMTPVDPPPSDRQQRGSGGVGRFIAAGAAVVILGFGGGVGGYYAADHWFDDAPTITSGAAIQPSNTSNVSTSSDEDGDAPTPRSVYAKAAPAVVHIEARVQQQQQSFFGIPTGTQPAIGTGSGFIIDDKGHIVTNAHVVDEATSLSVSFGDDLTVDARLIGEDKSSDLAVIKVDPAKLKDLPEPVTALALGDSAKLQVGDPVLAIGNPFSLDRTLTTGVVSALQRDIPALNDFSISDVIQTDAAVNPGNSGGPLLNMNGEVVGVNSQIESKGGGNDGIAFAVPSATVERIAKELIANGEVNYAWLGVEGGQLTDAIREKAKLDADQQGVMIGGVTLGSPADRAGLKGESREGALDGDVIVSFDGKKLTTMRELGDRVNANKPKDKVEVIVLRGGKEQKLTVTLGERPDSVKRQG